MLFVYCYFFRFFGQHGCSECKENVVIIAEIPVFSSLPVATQIRVSEYFLGGNIAFWSPIKIEYFMTHTRNLTIEGGRNGFPNGPCNQ